MITKDNFKNVLEELGFTQNNDSYTKKYDNVDCELKVDFNNEKLIYPTEKGFQVNDGTTSNFSHPENFVVFECVARLFEKGYRPEHIELEPRWSLGHGGKSGKADICIKNKDGSPYLCIIECKTADGEYKKEKQNMLNEEGGQLFSYWEQERATKWLILYASDFADEKITYTTVTVNCSDDENLLELSKEDKSLKLYKDATNAKSLFEVWKETYEQKFLGNLIFDEETVAYDIGVLPLKKKRLVDFSRDDKIVNQFEEILRHNNVSDKENAFNRLIALFIAKLYDEKTKSGENVVDFQYKSGTDTYQKMQDRLQKLHHLGMKEFMKEDVFYVADDYVQKLMKGAIGENREKLENELNETITKLKFYTNNDFAFKDVHNKTLFYQNGKILVEMVELFQKYRIIDSKELQLLGDMFEQLLNKGFKQNEGQFFTPVPITSFIWKCLPLESIVQDNERNEVKYPKVIDYACGAGHFLSEGFREINRTIEKLGLQDEKGWEKNCIFGIEKDYRLARVSKISLFMHGADNGNIVFGDGLDNHNEEIVVKNGEFDILVANPPYSVSAFKNHLELKNNKLELFDCITKDGKEIETLFVERIAQLLKPNGITAVILPSSILNNGSTSYIKAREVILKNFSIHSIVQFGGKTFGATNTSTVVLYLKKNSEPPVKSQIVYDNVSAIFTNEKLNVESDIEIFNNYCSHIQVEKADYIQFLKNARDSVDYECYRENKNYFSMYVTDFEQSAAFKTAQKQDEKQKTNINTIKAFYNFVLEIEKDKVYYFALVYTQKVLVVKAPDDNSAQEKFLGYSWSNRKGDEGIKPKEEGVLNKRCGYLYNVDDEENSIACYVKDSFLDIYRSEGSLQEYLNVYNLSDMLDFSRTTFDKAIKTSVQKKLTELSANWKVQYTNYRLSNPDDFELMIGKRVVEDEVSENYKIPVISANVHETFGMINKEILTDYKKPSVLWGIDGDWMVGYVAENVPFYPTDHCGVLRVKNKDIDSYFLSLMLDQYGSLYEFSRQLRASIDRISSITVSVPSLDIQKSIVSECEKIDKEYSDAQKKIEECKNAISAIMENVKGDEKKISEVCSVINPSKVEAKSLNEDTTVSFIEMASVSNDGYIEKKEDRKYSELKKGSYTYFAENDIIVAKITPCMENGKCAIAENLTNKIGFGSSEFHVFRVNEKVDKKYLFAFLNRESIREIAAKNMTGASGHRRVPISFYEDLQIPVPSLSEQQEIVEQITALEEQINAAKKVMTDCPQKKVEVLKKWLE